MKESKSEIKKSLKASFILCFVVGLLTMITVYILPPNVRLIIATISVGYFVASAIFFAAQQIIKFIELSELNEK